MSETRKIAAILAADVAGFSRLAGADEDRTLARLRALRADLIDPTIAVQNGPIVKRTGDGLWPSSAAWSKRCGAHQDSERGGRAQRGRRPIGASCSASGVHLGDVVEESDGDLMGDGVNIAARLEGIAEPGGLILSSAA